MNYFAHGRAFVDDPYFLVGTAVPDWLGVIDRRVRVRTAQAEPHLAAEDPQLARIAAGIVQHCRDDAWFHATRPFTELSLALTVMLRDRLPADEGFRPHFVGHILVEILLDATLIAAEPARLDAYYDALDGVDPVTVERAVNAISRQSTDLLSQFIPLFSRERFLFDYAADAKLLFRLNQVMRRVGLPLLPADLADWLPTARALVAERADELLNPTPFLSPSP
ncbi:MAG: hypothetical protein AB7O59_01285 [Pirellulales bacterium]